VSPRDQAPYFVIRKSKIQGRGAFATRRIRAGTRIVEYTGEVISQDEANRRYDDDTMGRHHTFLFALDDDRVIDGAVGGNDSRYINHSCAPNTQAVNEGGRIFVEALAAIEPGEELLYDYAYARTPENDNPESEALYACRCGAPTCRGSILEPARKTPARRAAAKTRSAGKTASAKKASAKKASAKKASAKKASGKKASSKASSTKSAAKRAPATKGPGTRAPAKKGGVRTATTRPAPRGRGAAAERR
jgi:hypothetical protein